MMLVSALILALVASFNAIIDPLAMNLVITIPGVNDYKPAAYDRMLLLKAYELRRVKPDSIILGSSRAHIGFRPGNAAWSRTAKTRYNLAFDSAKPKDMYYFLLHAQAVHPLKLVILCLDEYHPVDDSDDYPDFDENILMRGNSFADRVKIILTDLKILTSFDTLKCSFLTLSFQHPPMSPWFSSDGQRLGEPFFRRADGDLNRLTPRGYFDKYERETIKSKIEAKESKTGQKDPRDILRPEERKLKAAVYIRKIVDFCRAHDIDLKILFTPAHVHELELIDWNLLEKGKREMVKIISEDATRHPDKPAIPLFDFSGYSAITTEPLPPIGSRQELQYYWDHSHFKTQVGDFVLNRILNADDPKNEAPADFGIDLNENNIDSVLDKLRADRIVYQRQHPQDIQRLQAWMREFKYAPIDYTI